MESNIIIGVIALFLTIFGAIWSLAWWLSGQFTKIRNLIYEQIKGLESHFLNKLEYHEKHDDQRFAAISNDLWEIKMANAAMRGLFTEDKMIKNKKEI